MGKVIERADNEILKGENGVEMQMACGFVVVRAFALLGGGPDIGDAVVRHYNGQHDFGVFLTGNLSNYLFEEVHIVLFNPISRKLVLNPDYQRTVVRNKRRGSFEPRPVALRIQKVSDMFNAHFPSLGVRKLQKNLPPVFHKGFLLKNERNTPVL